MKEWEKKIQRAENSSGRKITLTPQHTQSQRGKREKQTAHRPSQT